VKEISEIKDMSIDDLLYKLDIYKAYYDRITALHDCNDCGIRRVCKYLPMPGETTRINCPLWKEGKE
jgi:hypothetical protein